MNVWFSLIKCPYCNVQREIHIGQKNANVLIVKNNIVLKNKE